MSKMREIQSVHNRMGGEPTFKNRRLTIGNMLTSIAFGTPLQAFADDYDIEIERCNNALKDIAQNIRDWVRNKRKWELWESKAEGSYTFATSEGICDMFAKKIMPSDATRIWTIETDSYIEAQRKMHEYLGWEPYKPMLDDNGNVYPDDAGDVI